MAIVIAYAGWQMSDWGGIYKSIGTLESKANEHRKGLERLIAESEKAHNEIKANIAKSRKNSKEKTKKVIRESEERLAALI